MKGEAGHPSGPTLALGAWGYWATFGWAVLAFVVGQVLSLVALVWWRGGDLPALLATPYDGITVSLVILLSNPITIAIILLAAYLARANVATYLALRKPSGRDIALGVLGLVVIIGLSDLILYLSGNALVTPFQREAYTSAASEGWLAALWLAAVIVAPAGEEVVFRGFLFRGWARSERAVWPAIVAISVVWSALHIQYDWLGVLQIFVVGLFLGWMRWRSGSIVLTFLLHALFNLEATIETVLQVRFSS